MTDRNTGDYVLAFENEIHKARAFHVGNKPCEVYRSFILLQEGLEVVLGLMGAEKQHQDYSDLDVSTYILRVEVCLEYTRRLIATGDAGANTINWLVDMLNHVNAFVRKYEEKELETSDLPKMQG